jgi:hypothetical protein
MSNDRVTGDVSLTSERSAITCLHNHSKMAASPVVKYLTNKVKPFRKPMPGRFFIIYKIQISAEDNYSLEFTNTLNED